MISFLSVKELTVSFTLNYLIQVGDGITVLDGRFLKRLINVGDGINVLGEKF